MNNPIYKVINSTDESFVLSDNIDSMKEVFSKSVSLMKDSPFEVSNVNDEDLTFDVDGVTHYVYVDLSESGMFMGNDEFVNEFMVS